MVREADLNRSPIGWDDPGGILSRITRGAVNLVEGANAATVELLDADDYLVPVCAEGLEGRDIRPRRRSQATLSALTMTSGSALHCNDTENDPRVDAASCRRAGARSMVCVPLIHGKTPIGVLSVGSPVAGAFDEGVADTLTELASFISTVVATTIASRDVASSRELVTVGAPANGNGNGNGLHPAAGSSVDGTHPDAAERVATFVTEVISPGAADSAAIRARVQHVLDHRAIEMVYQPVVKLDRRTTVALEALARFPGPPMLGPDVWFAQAHSVGLGIELELLAIEEALAMLRQLPPNIVLGVNASPTVILSPDLLELIAAVDAHRVSIEITEHVAVDDYAILNQRIAELRELGTAVSIDDTGSGYASFRHILFVAPEYIKLDLDLTRNIDSDPARRALAAALVSFVSESGARLIAEGIETAAEMETVQELGIEFGQGYHLGRPVPFRTLAIPGLRR
ncbi:MAG: sensor domain-containing phosphodiesterase [Acidimicrobiales bacterium]